jgi:hypothetical protein
MSFSRAICRGLVEGVDVSSRGFGTLMKNEKAQRGERGRTFADKLMNAMSRVNTNIPRPKLWADDRQEHYALPVDLMDREVESGDSGVWSLWKWKRTRRRIYPPEALIWVLIEKRFGFQRQMEGLNARCKLQCRPQAY